MKHFLKFFSRCRIVIEGEAKIRAIINRTNTLAGAYKHKQQLQVETLKHNDDGQNSIQPPHGPLITELQLISISITSLLKCLYQYVRKSEQYGTNAPVLMNYRLRTDHFMWRILVRMKEEIFTVVQV